MSNTNIISITPYKELHHGQDSIHNHISSSGALIPDKVIAYLRAPLPAMTCPGTYEHPFIKGRSLPGPDICTDGKHFWDRDTWKYVFKYNLSIPQEFIDYVMSGKGDAFIDKCIEKNESWSDTIKEWKRIHQGYLAFVPSKSDIANLEHF